MGGERADGTCQDHLSTACRYFWLRFLPRRPILTSGRLEPRVEAKPTERIHPMRAQIAAVGAAGALALALTPPRCLRRSSTRTRPSRSCTRCRASLSTSMRTARSLILDFEPGTPDRSAPPPAGSYDLPGLRRRRGARRRGRHRGQRCGGARRGQRHRRGSPRRRREPDPDPVRQRHQRNRSRRGSLTVRHTAAAPAVDVRADGDVLSPTSRTLTRARPTCRQGPTRPMATPPARSRSPSASLTSSSRRA